MAHNVYFARSLQAALPESVLPEGYSARALRGEADIEPYQALYDFAPVTVEHRRELLSSDEYSHLVVVDPSGEFAAYCESSICRAEWQLSGQRIGWIDYIGTRPERQRQGLGRAALLAALHWLQAQGARTAMLATISTNVPATSLYTRAGFTRADVVEPRTYQKAITLP
jgi:ribosomal protein S18 acetylase RimI-like enzyme